MRQREQVLYVIAPLFNEVNNLDRLLDSYSQLSRRFSREYKLSFILVDDGSTDGTAQRVEELKSRLKAIVLSHERNLGPGRAFATAFEYLHPRLKENDWVITMEGDNTSGVGLIHQMFLRAKEGYEVILASPYMYGGGILHTSPLRTFLSHVANAFVKEFLGIHGILTMSSFFRLYKGSVIRFLQAEYGPRIIERSGFECMIEILLKMMYLRTRISEVPMVLDGRKRMGKSKMKLLRTVLGYLTLWRDKNRWRPRSTVATATPHSNRSGR